MIKIASWKDCIDQFCALKVTPDKAKAKSLTETSKERVKFIETVEIKESNANYVFEIYYISALELMHIIAILNGYKVDNHICLGYYIKEVLKREDLFRLFDDVRQKRNSITYYGKRMTYEKAKESIEKIKTLIPELEKYIKL